MVPYPARRAAPNYPKPNTSRARRSVRGENAKRSAMRPSAMKASSSQVAHANSKSCVTMTRQVPHAFSR